MKAEDVYAMFWKLFVDDEEIAASSVKEPKEIKIVNARKGLLKIQSNQPIALPETKLSALIFDKQRQLLLQKEINQQLNSVTFDIEDIRQKTLHQSFEIHLTAIPTEPDKSSQIRVRPLLLCTIDWKN